MLLGLMPMARARNGRRQTLYYIICGIADFFSRKLSIAGFTHQFVGGPPPAPPGKDVCGVDPTEDELGCESFEVCP